MNPTAILHVTAAVLAGAGFFISGRLFRIGLFALAGVCFVAGILIARRDDADDAAPAGDA